MLIGNYPKQASKNAKKFLEMAAGRKEQNNQSSRWNTGVSFEPPRRRISLIIENSFDALRKVLMRRVLFVKDVWWASVPSNGS